MGNEKKYYVYIMTNHSGTLYTGLTSDLQRRVYQHKNGLVNGYTKRYQIHRLIYFEETLDIKVAIEREKQIKRWRREKKVRLVEIMNPEWRDLSETWCERGEDGSAE
jgi:putative endonuclease